MGVSRSCHPANDRGRRERDDRDGEWQRDWARTEHVEELTEILIQHFGGSGIAYLWEQQLLNTPVPGNAG
ncbi:hypothetical protein [Variovorax sp. MHTC-1]|uniref:hypothetical protein n=1 Tax=Variovorax sp. MHTC-1 TaxID=2495593 RepID=UPI0021AFE475|nr:hypothetical protein [Variovorax sp. MHTC-1]